MISFAKKVLFSILVSGFLSQVISAQVPGNNAKDLTPAKYLRAISVRIRLNTVPIFQGGASAADEGIGTGFIVEEDQERGRIYIFTNDHVVDSSFTNIQKVSVEVVGEGRGRSEEVDAKVEMTSPIHDFAVLSVDSKDLRAIKPDLEFAKIPSRDSLRYQIERSPLALQELPTKAYGYPLGVNHNLTSGTITSAQFRERGLYLITDTPINRGNSGGPLIADDNSFEVLGMNTAMLSGANSVGFVLPIGLIYEEFLIWKETRIKPSHRRFAAVLNSRNWKALKLIRMPSGDSAEYFLKNSKELPEDLKAALREEAGVLMVEHTPEDSSQLIRGDLVLAVEGLVVGNSLYLIKRAMGVLPPGTQMAKVLILRNGELMEVEVKVFDESFHNLRNQVDFVFFSGLLFSEWSEGYSWASYGPYRVYVRDIIATRTSIAMKDMFPNPGSILTGVSISGEYFSVQRLGDLKRALQGAFLKAHLNNTEAPSVLTLHVRQSVAPTDRDGNQIPIFDTLSQLLIYPYDTSYTIPLDEVLTPNELSLRKLRKGADLDPQNVQSIDWRHQAKGFLGCTESLERIQKRSARNRNPSGH